MTGKMHWHHPLFIVLVLNATLMLQAIPLPGPIPDGDYITYIGPIQLINTGESTDTEQVLRIVGSVQSAIENMIGNKPGVNLEISLGNKKIETSSIQPMVSESPAVLQEETTTATMVDTTAAVIEAITTTAAPAEISTETTMPAETTNPVVTEEEPSVAPATENAKKHVVTVVEMSNQTLIYVYDPLTVPPGMEPWRAHESSGATILGSTQQESSTSVAEIVTEVTVQTEPITVIATTEATIVPAVNEMTTDKPGAASMVNWLIKCLLSSDSTKSAGTVTNEQDSSKSSSWSSSWSNLLPAGSLTVSHEGSARSSNVRGAWKPSSSSTSWSSLNPDWTPKTAPIKEVMDEFEPRKIGKENWNSSPITVQSRGRNMQSTSGWNEEQPSKRIRTNQRFINEPFVHFGSRSTGRKSRQSTSSE